MREEYKQITELHQKLQTIYDLVKKYPNDMELGEKIRKYYYDDTETSYIYESPDGGKTVYRRKFNDHETSSVSI
mgnify:FL=1